MSSAETADAVLIVFKRLAKWVAIIAAALLLIAGVIAGSAWAYEQYKNRPRTLDRYMQVKLGDSRAEVFYALGEPVWAGIEGVPTPAAEGGGYIEPKSMPAGKKLHDYAEWVFGTSNGFIEVTFDRPDGVVFGVSCQSKASYGCPEVFGVGMGTDETEVRRRLGSPDKEELREGMKVLRYPALSLSVFLELRKVVRLRVSPRATPYPLAGA
jgi:hypothetical protein